MKVAEDPAYAAALVERLAAHMQREPDATPPRLRPKVHVSEMTGCLRRAVLKRLVRLPEDPDLVATFAAGRAQHDVIQSASGGTREYALEHEGMVGHVDIVHDDHFVEAKGTRRRWATGDDPATVSPQYIEQMQGYAALGWYSESHPRWNLGKLVVLLINGGSGERKPSFRAWSVTFTAEDHAAALTMFRERRDIILGAYEAHKGLTGDLRSVKAANILGSLPDGPRAAWECSNSSGKCAFYGICYGGFSVGGR